MDRPYIIYRIMTFCSTSLVQIKENRNLMFCENAFDLYIIFSFSTSKVKDESDGNDSQLSSHSQVSSNTPLAPNSSIITTPNGDQLHHHKTGNGVLETQTENQRY